jgi:HTH-type transcriptional regulator/antitoxin HigA
LIASERQYGISKTELQCLEGAVGKYTPGEEVDPRMREVMDDALRGQTETLRDEIKHYEDLRDGRINKRELGSLRDLPTALIEARIAAGLTQKALGERLEVPEQQVQRWETNLYSGVGVDRLQEVADALGMGVCETVSYAVPA